MWDDQYFLWFTKAQEATQQSSDVSERGEVKEDVTLACKDGREVEAHKVILVASNSLYTI